MLCIDQRILQNAHIATIADKARTRHFRHALHEPQNSTLWWHTDDELDATNLGGEKRGRNHNEETYS